ncbi:EAL domain-containing response regulator [Ancylobacter lacus]|uniref:EAL domain-containing response regulator n=1 Tax=Ancylobacter lacus TaxID=2579970 RepID=UPI001BD0CFE5|nr:EAL domain-containing response regulator [Ancylobacter lacus]MBS7538418.1 EAL domain-containing response regulator [Ancylobacter lacus]
MPQKQSFYVLDDDADFRLDLGEALEAESCDVASAADPAAVDMARLAAADILLLDLAMPTLDGIGMLERLSALPRRPALIFISGSGEELLRTAATLARSRGLVVLGALQKPFAPQDVLALACRHGNPVAERPAAGTADLALVRRALASALDEGTVPVLFQPLAACENLVPVGAEALLSDDLPGFGPIPPWQLVLAAEEDPALMIRLSHHVLQVASRTCALWRQRGGDGFVSVNMPLHVFTAPRAVAEISAIVEQAGTPASHVMLELTEDALYDSSNEALEALARLRLAGFGLALDDVGKRQSGLLQLANLPVTEMKIDLEFMRQARIWTKPRSIFGSLAELGHELGLKVVAEGVETAEDWELARACKVDYVQGFMISRKRPAEDIITLLTRGQPIDTSEGRRHRAV